MGGDGGNPDDTLEMELQRRNEELEKELQMSLERERKTKEQLRMAWDRLRMAEEAEECLCRQLGELEAEAFHHAHQYRAHLMLLMEQLALTTPSPSSL